MSNYFDELASTASSNDFSLGIDDEELELLIGLIEDADLDIGDFDEVVSDFHSRDIKSFSELDVAEVFKTNKNSSEYRNKLSRKTSKIRPGSRLYRVLCNETFISNQYKAISKDGVVIIENTNIQIGVSKVDCEFIINGENLFKLADAYTEEVKGKGSGYGFSMLCHLMATLSLTKNEGYLEPLEGCDYTMKSESIEEPLTFEVTGMNYKNRKTSANIILNKYLILMTSSSCEKVKRCIKYSDYEETGKTDFLRYSDHFQGESEYTKHFDKMHELLEKLKEDQIEEIKRHVQVWLNHDIKLKEIKNESKIDFKLVGDKNELYPAPFRVRCMKHDDRLCSVKPEASLWKDNSGHDWYEGKHGSFHVCKGDVDYISMCKMESLIKVVNREYEYTVDDKASNMLEKYQSIQELRVTYELLDKIQGLKGVYYSNKNGVGISWSTSGKECLTYNCIFYGSEKPDEQLFGTWVEEDCYFRSPGFKVSRQDISFYNKIYASIVTMYTSVHNSSSKDEVDIIDELMPIYTKLVSNSSWMTSNYSDNCRFTTTGHLSGNNVNNLMIQPIIKGKPIRNSEMLYFKLVERFIEDPPLRTKTPLLRLPIKFICLEKDLGLAMNWRNRQADHETECCRKIIERSIEEREIKDKVVKYYEFTNKFLEKLLSIGVTYNETRDYLNMDVPDPLINPVFYIACCKACEKEIETAGATQVNTGFSLNDMVSDRGSFRIENGVGKDSKVVNELRSMVHKNDIKGPYDGLLKVFDMKLEHHYLIRSKNGRGRREFATQTIEKRFEQSFEEKLASGISMSAPDDKFLDPHKYNDMVRGFIEILSSENPVSASSEDRKNHCGHNMPEAIAICTHIHAIVNKIPYFNTLTAIKRCNTYRWCILPENFNHNKIDTGILETKWMSYISRNKMTKRKMIKVYKHGMQGMGAVIAGVTNTTSVKGVMNMVEDYSVKNSYLFTTQDDVGRAIEHSNNCDPTVPEHNFLRKPVETLKFVLQENNERKFVTITHDKAHLSLVEVNNIAITGNGMLRQEYIHPFINIQPFTSDSIVLDLMQCVGNSRQSIFWGDSPTTAMSCYNNSIRSLSSKWLFTVDEINYLKEIKFLPSNSNELISGFFPRSVDAIKIFVNYNTDEELNEVKTGEKSLFTNAARQYSKSAGKNDTDVVTILETNMKTFDHKSKKIYQQRKEKGRLSSAFVKPLLFKVRLDIKNKFMSSFKNAPRNVEKCEEMLGYGPPEIEGFVKPMKSEHMMPCMMGEVVGEQMLSRKALLCKKILGCEYRTALTEDELIELNKDEFWENMMKELRYQEEEGFEVHSPSGLPVVRFLDGKLYTKPKSFNFKIKLSKPNKCERPFVYRGATVQSFKPILYGGASLEHMKSTICFGRGLINGEEFVFYKKGVKGKLSHHKVIDSTSYIVNVTEGEGENMKYICSYINFEDWSPFRCKYRRFVPGIEAGPHATLNYAGFLRSNSESGFQVLRKIYEDNDSFMPSFVDRYMPDYPRFHNECVDVKCGDLNLIGDTMISKIRFVYSGNQTKYYEITREPREIVGNVFVI
jgi:hypothetical protein